MKKYGCYLQTSNRLEDTSTLDTFSSKFSAASRLQKTGNDGPCSCCKASATAWVDIDIQAAQRPSNILTTLSREELRELAQFQDAAVDMLAMQTPESNSPLFKQAGLQKHRKIDVR